MIGALVLLTTLVVATAAGLVLRFRNGRLRTSGPVADAASQTVVAEPSVDLASFGAELGDRATLVQFSSAFCAPCRATRALLTDVADLVPGVRHVEIDVADGPAAMAAVRSLDIRRTPTTLVLDARGQEVRRASGLPRREQVLAALGDGVDGPADARV